MSEASYIYISYCDSDKKNALEVIRLLENMGYRLKYRNLEQGNTGGTENPLLKDCSFMIALVSRKYFKEDYCVNELIFARDSLFPNEIFRHCMFWELGNVKYPDFVELRYSRCVKLKHKEICEVDSLQMKLGEFTFLDICRSAENVHVLPTPKHRSGNIVLRITVILVVIAVGSLGWIWKGKQPAVLPEETDSVPEIVDNSEQSKEEPVIVDSGECGDEGSNVTWTIDNNGTLTISGTGKMEDTDMYANKYPSYVVYNDMVRDIIVEPGVTRIGSFAFSYFEHAKSIKLSDTVEEIGWVSMCIPKIQTLNIPASVTSIEYGAFIGCTGLMNIIVDPKNEQFEVKNGALIDKNANQLIIIPRGTKGKYIVPEEITNIETQAFAYCGELTSVVLPENLKSVGPGIFIGCKNLKEIEISDENLDFCTIDGILFNKSKKRIWNYPAGKKSKEYVIPDGIEIIGCYAFDSSRLESISIPESIRLIENGAFCDASTELIVIPSGLQAMEGGVFSSGQIKSVYFAGEAPTLQLDTFKECKATIFYPEGDTMWESYQNWEFDDADIIWESWNP